MSVSFGAKGTTAYGSTSVAPAYPTGITAGMRLLLVVVTKPGATAVINRPSGWRRRINSDSVGTSGTNGTDAGPTRIAVFERVAEGTETGTVSVSITSGNSSWGDIYRVESSTGEFDIQMAVGEDTSSGTGFSAACQASAGWATAGDLLIAVAGKPTDSGTWSAHGFAATGLTIGARTEIAEYTTSTGNDIGGCAWYATVSSGTMSGTSITASATLSNSTYGPAAIIRVRDTEPFPMYVVDTNSASRDSSGSVTVAMPSGAAFAVAIVVGESHTPPSGWTQLLDLDDPFATIYTAQAGAGSSWGGPISGLSVALTGYNMVPDSIDYEYDDSDTNIAPAVTAVSRAMVIRAMHESSSSPGVIIYPEGHVSGVQQVQLKSGWSNTVALAHKTYEAGPVPAASWTWTGSSGLDDGATTILLYLADPPEPEPETSTLYIGAERVTTLYYGPASVVRAYYGSELVWGDSPPGVVLGIVGTNKGSILGSGSTSVTPPPGAAFYMAVTVGYVLDITPPSGWSLFTEVDEYIAIWIAGSGAGSSWSIDSDDHFSITMTGYDGVPLAIQTSWNDQYEDDPENSANISPEILTDRPALICHFYAATGDHTGQGTVTFPAEDELGQDYEFFVESPTGSGRITAMSHRAMESADYMDDAQWTVTNTDGAWVGITAALYSAPPQNSTGTAPGSYGSSIAPYSIGALSFEDDFNGSAGAPINGDIWLQETWTTPPNNELQEYTAGTNNVYQDGSGNLAIVARDETSPAGRDYTSGRVASWFSQKYGRFEARIKVPYGQGIWPAFWMLGTSEPYVDWPGCGEIDIMEIRGQNITDTEGNVHGTGYIASRDYDGAVNLSADFHIYSIDWIPGKIIFYLDGVQFGVVNYNDSEPNGDKFAQDFFDHFLLLNVAVGGDYVGSPDGSTVFPQTMLVDYVRVWKLNGIP